MTEQKSKYFLKVRGSKGKKKKFNGGNKKWIKKTRSIDRKALKEA